MKIRNMISIPAFLISLFVGIFFVYITMPNRQVILVYPNPDNSNKLLFKDDAGICHRFVPREVKCPKDLSKIRKYPVSLKK